METFFGVILSIILGFYVLGKILKFVFRIWLARKAKEFQQRGGFSGFGGFNTANGSNNQYNDTTKREGEVKVEKTIHDQRKINEKVGEYVDFDEVK